MTLARCTQCGFSGAGRFCSACGHELSVDGVYAHAAREVAAPVFDILHLSKLILKPARLGEEIGSGEITAAAAVKFFIAIALSTTVIQYFISFMYPELKVTNYWIAGILSIPFFGDLLLLIYYGIGYAIIQIPMNYIFFQKRPFYKLHEAMMLAIVISALSLPVDIMSNLFHENSNELLILSPSYAIMLGVYQSFVLSKIYERSVLNIITLQFTTAFIITILIVIPFGIVIYIALRGR